MSKPTPHEQSEGEHTKTPWHVDKQFQECVGSPDEESFVANCNFTGYQGDKLSQANAQRIVSCVNALSGYNPDMVEALVEGIKNQLKHSDCNCRYNQCSFICYRCELEQALAAFTTPPLKDNNNNISNIGLECSDA